MNLLSNSPIARLTDPETSHLSAEEITKSGERARQQHAVLVLVKKYPSHTSMELSRSGIDRHTIARRLPELESAGLVCRGQRRCCGVTGKMALTWRPV